MINIFRKKRFSTPISALVGLCHLGMTIFTPYALAATAKESAESAQSFYQSLPGISANSNGTVGYGGQEVDLNSAYYGKESSSTSLNDLSGVYGDDSSTTKIGTTTGQNLSTESSLRGEAYRTLQGSTQTTANIKATDPIFSGHNDFLDNQDKYLQDLDDCSMTTKVTENDSTKHIPDYQECTRTTSVSGTFNLYHPYDAGLLSHSSGPANIASCGTDCIRLWIGTVGDNYWSGNCRIFEEEMSVKVYNPEAITSVRIIRAKWDDYMQIWIGETGKQTKVWAGPSGLNVFPPETSGACERNTSWDQNPNVDVTQKFRESSVNGVVHFKTRVSVTGEGEGYALLEIRFDKSKMISEDYWYSDKQEDFDTFKTAVDQGFCQNYTITCNDTPVPNGQSCAIINGAEVCENQLAQSPLTGLSNFCRSATIVSNCGKDGGVNNSCKAYDENSACTFIKSTCITGAAGGTSGCWQATELWDCGTSVTVPSTSASDEYTCAGAVQCLNGTCLTPTSEASTDFQTAVGMLQAATYAVNEMSCGDGTIETNQTCTLFTGEAMQCKTAMGGWVDCCNQPVDVGWIQYLQLTYYTLKVADTVAVKAGMFEQGKGIFDMGSELATKALDAITKPAISAFNSLTGNAGAAVAEKVSDVGISGLMDQAITKLTQQAAQWTLDAFGPSVTNMLFESTASGAGSAAVESSGSLAAGGVQLSSTLVSAVSVVGYAYMAYQIANILVNIIWACTPDEFKLAVKKETKLATFITSWCQTKVLGQCIEKRSSYCAFNSQIARIIQEQGRQQLGIGWGDEKSPDCRGLTLDEFGRLDFNKIDLSEWIASLYTADLLPTTDSISLDEITGSGSILNVDGTRKNTLERFQDGVDSIDIDEVKQNAEDSITVK